MQDSIIIEMPRDLTSYEFYHNVVRQLQQAKQMKVERVMVDFSETIRIEPLVIPNLLCMGYILEESCGMKADVYIPDIIYSGKVKNYLNQVGFTKYAKKYELFNFITSPYGGLEGKMIDPVCGTMYFSANDTTDEICQGIKNCITPFADEYLYRFKRTRVTNEGVYEVNEIVEFLEEILANCKYHAKSFSFTTLHAKYSTGKIYISTSDVGGGFSSTINRKSKCSELEAIMLGVYERKNSHVYGLFNVIRRVLELGGRVRIHSSNTQVIFTQKILEDFVNERLWYNKIFRKFNVKNNIPFEGVHIEIELPLERRNDVVYY